MRTNPEIAINDRSWTSFPNMVIPDVYGDYLKDFDSKTQEVLLFLKSLGMTESRAFAMSSFDGYGSTLISFGDSLDADVVIQSHFNLTNYKIIYNRGCTIYVKGKKFGMSHETFMGYSNLKRIRLVTPCALKLAIIRDQLRNKP